MRWRNLYSIGIPVLAVIVIALLFPAIQRNRINLQFLRMTGEPPAAIREAASEWPDLAYKVARIYLDEGQREEAKRWLDLASSGRLAPLALRDLCVFAWEDGDIDQAVKVCKDGDIPAKFWVNQGLAFQEAGSNDAAMQAYLMAVLLEPAWPTGHDLIVYLAQEYNQDVPGLIRLLEPVVSRHPQASPQVYRFLANAYRQSGQADRALELLQSGIARFPDSAELMLLLAYIYQDRGDFDQAVDWYDQYLQRNPGDLYATLQWAEIAEKTGDVDHAIQLYRKITGLNPNDVKAWMSLGRLLRQAGQTKNAIEAYQQALRLDPANPVAKEQLELLR